MSVVFGMLRQHKFNFIDVYREEAYTALKATIKQVLKQKEVFMFLQGLS